MGLLRDVVTAFKPSSIARGLEAARNPPSDAEIEASLASLTPEQRAAYDANMAAVERGRAESQAAWEQTKAISDRSRVLEGPAGRYVYGAGVNDVPEPGEIERMMRERGTFEAVRELRELRRGEFKQVLRQTFGMQEVKQVSDPAERARIAAAELAARDAARAPYRAPAAAALRFTRIATRGETQLAELIAHLQASGLAADPARVFGVARVPDRVSQTLTPHSEKGRVVEWEIVDEPGPAAEVAGAAGAPGTAGAPHATHPASPPTAPLPVATSFHARDRWVARRIGEPSLIDEELALAFCLEAGIGPERCLGLARVAEFRELRGTDEDGIRTLVQGVVAIHPPEASGAFARMRAAAPLPLPPDLAQQAGVHVELLNWEGVARAVHLKVHHPPPAPSPFPYLPATPQELLRAYLEVVGVQPFDCYAAAATVDRARPLIQGGMFTTNMGPKQPCADGEERMRTRGCELVAIVYRDRPDYAAGRERWAAYERDVLQARLGNGLRRRPPLELPEEGFDGIPKLLRPAARVGAAIDALTDWEWGVESPPAYRYCWPPLDVA